ncbi:hypothetical protein HOA55_05395 [archaeon]|nr:hypothetical protein [archaeon]MBT3577757.1 hypothetical protein [archaeon]MBT6820764.1 hypothetical protein [archaeon]MBT6956496.1 hypothetical protein [archaeon]MBT7025904.1 hypothetical protein [archaeon]
MNKIMLLVIISLLLCNLTSASLNIGMNIKDSFDLNEKISFSYTVSSDENLVVRYVKQIICPDAPPISAESEELNLSRGENYSGIYDYLTIYDSIEPQTCTAYVEILSPVQQKVEKTFTIDTLPSFSFDLEMEKSIFILGETIDLNYTSEVENPLITATLTSPSGKSKDIEIPSTLELEEIGTYGIDVQASKEGYKTIQVSRQIGVIEGGAEIVEGAPSVAKERAEEDSSNILLWILGIIVLVVLVIILVIIFLKRRREPGIEEMKVQN